MAENLPGVAAEDDDPSASKKRLRSCDAAPWTSARPTSQSKGSGADDVAAACEAVAALALWVSTWVGVAPQLLDGKAAAPHVRGKASVAVAERDAVNYGGEQASKRATQLGMAAAAVIGGRNHHGAGCQSPSENGAAAAAEQLLALAERRQQHSSELHGGCCRGSTCTVQSCANEGISAGEMVGRTIGPDPGASVSA